MASAVVPAAAARAPSRVPDGFAAVPVSAAQLAASLRICALVRKQPDPVAGHLVLLRDTLDAQVYLGCVADAGGMVQQWIELWVQSPVGLATSLPARRENLTNALLDTRWARHVEALDRSEPGAMIRTGWEAAHPLPTFLDASKNEPVHPAAAPGGHAWRLCRDDSLLASLGLPPYSTSLHRYLYVGEAGPNAKLIATTPEAPTSPATIALSELLAGRKDLIPFNPAGGLMMVRRHAPHSFETFLDMLAGGTSQDGNGTDEGWLYLGKHGKSGRLLESFHLKLRALGDAVRDVAGFVRDQKRPLLNVSAVSFRVRMGESGAALPTLWTSRSGLVDPGDAIELAIEGSDTKYFLPGRPGESSIYRPDVAAYPVHGKATARVRQVLPEAGGAIIVEGTLATQERVTPGKSDVVWMRLPIGSAPVNLYARVDTEKALAAGEFRLRTVPQRVAPDVAAQLTAAAGVPINNTTFEVLSHLSSPCDLYGLGVLAVRALLVSGKSPLPVALDELLSLARQVAVEHDSGVALGVRIHGILERDARFLASLGPHHLVQEELSPAEAFDLIPAEVWCDALGMIVGMFPGIGPDSRCADLGDAPAGGLHKVFERALSELDSLLLRTRSLIVIDWRANREIHAVVRGFLTGLAGKAQPAANPKAVATGAARR
jgi:hypothetical protein